MTKARLIIMRIAAAFLGLLLCCLPLHAADPGLQDRQLKSAPGRAEVFSQATLNKAFRLELSIGGGKLELGPNSLDLTVRDKAGQAVEGAAVTVTPWMPSMGHGVWDRPVVTERGGGRYHVENVKIIMSGLWELRIKVRKGSLEELATFPFDVAGKEELAYPKKADKQAEGYERSVANYSVPDVTLLNQDGETVSLRTLAASGKPVIMDFIFTTCTTVCPLLSAGLSNLRAELGERSPRVQMISITIDPEQDRPEQLKEYGSRFDAGAGWTFLTGSREEIGRVLQAFDAIIVDKMSHEPLYVLRGPNSDEWIRIRGLVGSGDLLKEFRRIENR
jgi:protein SCO1